MKLFPALRTTLILAMLGSCGKPAELPRQTDTPRREFANGCLSPEGAVASPDPRLDPEYLTIRHHPYKPGGVITTDYTTVGYSGSELWVHAVAVFPDGRTQYFGVDSLPGENAVGIITRVDTLCAGIYHRYSPDGQSLIIEHGPMVEIDRP